MTTTNAQKNEDPQSQIGTSSSSASSHQEKSLNTENEQEMEALFRRAISNSSFLNVSRKNPFKPIDESLARNRWRKTKTMATCGPSFCTEEQIAQLLYLDDRCQQPDLDCLRLNLAHNFLDFHEGVLNAVKRLRQRYEHSYKLHGLAILAELRGSQVRTQKLEETQILHQSDVVNIRVSSNDNSQSGECISEMYDKDIDEEDKDNFTIFLNMESFGELKSKTSLEKNDIIYIDYGRLVLQVNKIHEKAQYLRAVMKNSGKLGSSKFVSFRGKSTEWILTEKDFEDIEFCVNHGVDMIAVPAVQSKAHVLSVRKLIRSAAEKLGLQGKPLPRVFSKISDRNGVVNLDEIIKASDGIIIARGSIGVNVPLHTVAIVQKMIIQKCNQACIPVIVGSQVLRSMYKNPLPTRAEMSDVLNATMDGCDCVMVAITAHGKYPLEAVKTLSKALREADIGNEDVLTRKFPQPSDEFRAPIEVGPSEIIRHIGRDRRESMVAGNAANMANMLNSNVLISLALKDGASTAMISKCRPSSLILCFTCSETTARYCALFRDVIPYVIEEFSFEDLPAVAPYAASAACNLGLAQEGEQVVVFAGTIMKIVSVPKK